MLRGWKMKYSVKIIGAIAIAFVMLMLACDDSATDLNTPTPGNLGGNEEASVSDGMVLSVDARFASDAMVLDAATDSDAMVPTVDALLHRMP